MHGFYYGTPLPPHRVPIPLQTPSDRIGDRYLHCSPEKIAAIVKTNSPDCSNAFAPPDETSRQIAGCLIEFLRNEVARGRLPASLHPLQSRVGNVTNAVLAELGSGGFSGLTAHTEVIQDGMLDPIENGTLTVASATALSLGPPAVKRFTDEIKLFRERIILRPQDISPPGTRARLGCIAMNGMIDSAQTSSVKGFL